MESFLPPELPNIQVKPGDMDVSPKPIPEVESIPNVPSPGKEEETPAIPAEDEGIQNHSTEAVTTEVIVTDQVDGVELLTPTTPSSQKRPPQVYSTPESLKTIYLKMEMTIQP